MEYMDAGSLEKVSGCDVGEGVLARVTRDVVRGLKFLKDELKIMHRGSFVGFGLSFSRLPSPSLYLSPLSLHSYPSPPRAQAETVSN